MRIYIILTTFFLAINLNAQTDSSYRFIPINLNLSDTINLSLTQKKMGFISKREYKKKSFIDNHILCSSNDKICSVEFKKIGLDWYIKSNNKWIVFFSNIKKKILKGTLKKNNYKYKIEPKLKIKKDSISDLYCFSFTMMDSKQSETNIFWFNPTLGIVIVENSEFALIRSDFLKKIKR